MKTKTVPKKTEPVFWEGADAFHVLIRENTRARRLTLRLDEKHRRFMLSIPPYTSQNQINRFLTKNTGWMENNWIKLPQSETVRDGMTITVLGTPYRLEHIESGPRGIAGFKGETIWIKGSTEHLPRRLCDFLKKQAKAECSIRAREKAAQIEKTVTKITVRDTKSRWGSCSSKGSLSFSWRLIFAPEYVLDYVIAHEVAHLVHMNHSKAFWTLCDSLTDAGPAARQWLKKNASELMKYSF